MCVSCSGRNLTSTTELEKALTGVYGVVQKFCLKFVREADVEEALIMGRRLHDPCDAIDRRNIKLLAACATFVEGDASGEVRAWLQSRDAELEDQEIEEVFQLAGVLKNR